MLVPIKEYSMLLHISVDTGKIKLDIDPKQTEKECDKAMKDLLSFIKESSKNKSEHHNIYFITYDS